MFQFVLHKPIIVTVALLMVCLFGVLSYFRLPVQMIPDTDSRVISIRTYWRGATPQDIEKEILIEQEEYLRRISGLERMISTATTGAAQIELEFPFSVDINDALLRVNNAVTQVPSYPENVDEPRITLSSFSSNSFMYYSIYPLPGNPKNLNMVAMLDFLEDNVRTFLERVPGVDSVRLLGGQEIQIRIYVDPVKLVGRDISLLDVRNAIRVRNRDVSGGDLDFGKRRYILRTLGRFRDLTEMENMVVARQGDALVRLKDVGYVERDTAEIRSIVYSNGERVVNLSVKREIGANVIAIKEAMNKVVAELNDGYLKQHGMQMKLISEDVRYVEQSVKVVSQSLLVGSVLATLILFLFLRSTSATLVGAIGIPVCTVSAFLGLLLTGRTMNVISMAGVAFAIGMTLDNSIVVLENIYKHMDRGMNRMQAALEGVREVWPAILASTLTTVFVFLPIVFIREEAGQLYSDVAVAISASILMSMIVAITVIPIACSRFLSPNKTTPARIGFYAFGQYCGARVMNFVSWLTEGIMRRVVLIISVLSVTALILDQLTPKAEYLPEGEEKKIFARVFPPPGYNIKQMNQIALQLNEMFVPHLGKPVADYDMNSDELPPLDYIITFASSGATMSVIEVTSRQHLDKLVEKTQDLIKFFPGVLTFVSRGSIFSSNSGGTRSINLDISGRNIEELYATGLAAFIRSQEIFDQPRVRPEPSSLTLGQPMIEIHPDWERAAELGISANELGYIIRAYSDGAFVDEYFEGDNKVDMFLYSTRGVIESPSDLDHLLLYSREGGMIPLSAVAKAEDAVNTEQVRRVNSRRTITLSIIPPENIALEESVEVVKRDLIKHMRDSGMLGDTINIDISGAIDRLDATRQALQTNFITAVLVAYLLMVAIFSHWVYPLLIMTSVPIGISGGIAGLWLVNMVGGKLNLIGMQTINQSFDMITMLGFLVLIGTVVNNPILLVERAMANIRERGMDVIAAIKESTESRLRPIMMSMITTIVGLSPLVFNPGEGTELYRGLGAIVLFGLLFSTLITLTFIPSLLSLILQFRQHIGCVESAKPQAVDLK